ncbi:hypothetical protein WA026_007857 [Henosepilachna vigintioctopunctata]|uniref:Uncharacterized protein n=1 Tax=Henosepilachna vigintioctopunctata TaxID=420089 RepID=A0AAW1U476_9CUCU
MNQPYLLCQHSPHESTAYMMHIGSISQMPVSSTLYTLVAGYWILSKELSNNSKNAFKFSLLNTFILAIDVPVGRRKDRLRWHLRNDLNHDLPTDSLSCENPCFKLFFSAS